jgi:hypothetical protein
VKVERFVFGSRVEVDDEQFELKACLDSGCGTEPRLVIQPVDAVKREER